MNHIIACTLGLLGAGALCSHGESAAAPANGRPVAPEKDKYSITPGRQGNAQEVKKSVASVTVSSAMGHASCVKISTSEPEKAEGMKSGAYSVTTRNGPAPGEMEISVTPKTETLLTRKVAVSAGAGCVPTDKAGAFKEAAYSIKTQEKDNSGKMEMIVTPRQEGVSDEISAVQGKEQVVVITQSRGTAPVMEFMGGDGASSGIIISTVKGEKAEGVKEAAYSITTAKDAVPGSMKISVVPVKEEASSGTPAAPDQAAVKKDDRAVIQIALLLDTSGSMTGLINQARTYLWKIVNDMTLARQNGKLPDIRIALYEYGNDGLSSKDAWIRQVLPLTDDLDKVSEELFKLKTNGGTECCGAVIDRAVKELKWNTEDPNALKLVFIAGNEPFNQGSVPYAESIARGLAKGITVNTIHCGSAGDRDTALWKDGAKKGDGSFLNIDHNATPPDPETPYDGELAKLSSSLNGTYLAYGSREVQAERLSKQESQDKLARELSSTAYAGRVKAKANKAAYRNTSWDLVDLYERDGAKALGNLNGAGQLPKELEGKTPEEVEAVVKKKAEERGALQKKVMELDAQRSEWLAKWKAQQSVSGNAGPDSLDDAIIRAVRKQASKKQFSFVKENGAEGKNSPMK